jgi:hypothetical protein
MFKQNRAIVSARREIADTVAAVFLPFEKSTHDAATNGALTVAAILQRLAAINVISGHRRAGWTAYDEDILDEKPMRLACGNSLSDVRSGAGPAHISQCRRRERPLAISRPASYLLPLASR